MIIGSKTINLIVMFTKKMWIDRYYCVNLKQQLAQE